MMLVCRLDRFDDTKSSDDESNSNRVPDPKNIPDSTFQVAASWQANKNCLLKVPYLIQSYACDIGAYQDHETCAHFLFIPAGKGGPSQSSLAFAFKSWWKPSFTFSVSGMFIC